MHEFSNSCWSFISDFSASYTLPKLGSDLFTGCFRFVVFGFDVCIWGFKRVG